MRNAHTLLTTCSAVLILLASCAKDEAVISTTPSSTTDQLKSSSLTLDPISLPALARYAGDDYSQSISTSLANEMIGSYLASVSYPSYDTALRSLTFDADTLRSYLQDTTIKTLRFYAAHTPAYVSTSKGKYAGFNPGALTFIIAGLTHDDVVVKNNRGEVYEHMIGCPMVCNGSSAVFIQ